MGVNCPPESCGYSAELAKNPFQAGKVEHRRVEKAMHVKKSEDAKRFHQDLLESGRYYTLEEEAEDYNRRRESLRARKEQDRINNREIICLSYPC
jgi:hypothetical protein